MPECVKKVIGLRESIKAVGKDLVSVAYVANDANPDLTGPFIDLCRQMDVKVEYATSSRQLGLSNGIDVCASVVCILK